MLKNKKLLAVLAIPVVIGGWAAFRPELLFVNKTVDEKLPTTSNEKVDTLAKGSFTSQAHETTGTAEIVKIGDKNFLKLSGFHTSNGPDVRVYLTDGTNPSAKSLALGAIKGNIGNQNYELSKDYDATKHTAVSIWCERFAVGFGIAKLTGEKMQSSVSSSNSINFVQLAGATDRTEVTFGSAKGDSKFAGKATLVEEKGKRSVELRFSKSAEGYEFRLVKKETLAKGDFPAGAEFVKLTAPKASGKNKFNSNTAISKEIDLWLYRSIAILDAKTKKIVSFVLLRSSQEGKQPKNLI